MTDTTAPVDPAPQAPPTVAVDPVDVMTRLRNAQAAMNKAVGADIHDRMHAQAAMLNALAEALFYQSGG